MKQQIIELVTALIAAVILMVVHELSKSLVYYSMDHDEDKMPLRHAFKLHRYIDPIGLIFCITTYGGFSKPYMYKIKNKAVSKALGIAGFLSLGIVFFSNVLLLKGIFMVRLSEQGMLEGQVTGTVSLFFMYLCFHFAFMSLGMLFVNLFPLASFDMGNVVAGISPMKFFELLSKDYFMKLILLFTFLLGIIPKLVKLALVFMVL